MMAKALALNGAHKVYIIGRRKDVLEKAAASVPTENIIPLVGDVTSKESLASIVSTITSEVGYINVLIANSGILGPSRSALSGTLTIEEFQKIFGEISFEEYNETFRVNVVAVWFTVVAFLGLLDAGNKKGNVFQRSQVITTSSIAGFNRMSASSFAYGQTKAAATHLAKQLASGLVPYGIRSNAIAPGCEFCFHLYRRCRIAELGNSS
jgi:NAD(P)-dependent dehydrogenase (short-subunit alcohol dehydrogenase family)